VAIVAGACQKVKTISESQGVLRAHGIIHAVERWIDKVKKFDLASVRAVFFNVIKGFGYLPDLEIRESPVLIDPGKPQFGVMHLYARHEFTEPRFVCVIQLLAQAVDLQVELAVFRFIGAGIK
jgi:hypothetical protein